MIIHLQAIRIKLYDNYNNNNYYYCGSVNEFQGILMPNLNLNRILFFLI